jgi:hypothetical protein
MFIAVYKTGSRYAFVAGDDQRDEKGACLDSVCDASVLGDIPTTFNTYGEAHSAASWLVDERSSSILAKKASFYGREANDASRMMAESDNIGHYNTQIEIESQRVALLRGTNPNDKKEELEASKNVLDGLIVEIGKMQELAESESGKKAFEEMKGRLSVLSAEVAKMMATKVASAGLPYSSGLPKLAIRTFSEAAMLAIQPIHEDVFVKGGLSFPEKSTYESVLSTPKGDVVRLAFDRNLLLTGVFPCSMAKCAGAHSEDFLRRYWEPIVNAVGHFHAKGHGVVAVTGIDNSKRDRIKAFGMADDSESYLAVKRCSVIGRGTWMLGKTAATITNPPKTPIVINDEVECVNQTLPSYAGRTGVVVEVNAQPGMILYRIDFRRGLGEAWLEDKSVKKVRLGA